MIFLILSLLNREIFFHLLIRFITFNTFKIYVVYNIDIHNIGLYLSITPKVFSLCVGCDVK